MDCIAFKAGYKYQLKETYEVESGIVPKEPLDTEFLAMTAEGRLTVKRGYAWDGPSGPTIDTPNFMRGSLVHDALYQLMREGRVDAAHRDAADRLLQAICIEDGMTKVRAWVVYQGVHFGGGPAVDPANEKPLKKAPKRGAHDRSAILICTMHVTRRTVLGGAAAAPSLVTAEPLQDTGEKLNLIQIVVDTWGTHWMGCYGATQVKTPNVDRLASESVVFEDAYPESLPTLPARRVLYTGRRVFPSAMIPQPDDPVRIRGWHPLFAEDATQSEALKAAGYNTAIISDVYHQFKPGKNFHRGYGCWRWVRGQEADRLESGPRSAINVSRYLHPSQPAQNPGVFQYLLNRREWKTADDYFAARVFRDAARWIESAAREVQPFYLHIESFSPHEYWDPPDEYYRMYMKADYRGPRLIHPPAATANMSPIEVEHARALYAGLVTYVDAMIGEFLRKAESMGLLQNTVVALVGDHGTMMGEQGQLHKGETRIRTQVTHVPLMIRHPKLSARRVKGYAQHTDLMPTLLDVLGVPRPSRVTGESLRRSLETGQAVRREGIVTGWGEHGAVRTPEWIYIGRWNEGPPLEELYDVRRDPLELQNVAASNPAVVAEFRKRLKDHVAEGWQTTRGSFQS